MRFHLLGDFRFPLNPEYIYDSYNSKIMRFIKLFRDHIVFLYGTKSCEQMWLGLKNVTYISIDIEEKFPPSEELKNPSIMLTTAEYDEKYATEFYTKIGTAISRKYIDKDLVIHTAGAPIFNKKKTKSITCVNYSVGCLNIWNKYTTCESKYIKRINESKSWVKELKYIEPYFDEKDFPELDIPREENTYLYIGRCSSLKGADRFLEIAENFLRIEKPGKFIIAGGSISTEKDVLNVTMIDGTLKSYKLSEYPNVEYLGTVGVVERNLLLRRATCLIQLSNYDEPCGYNVIEAQYCGCPVICSDLGGMRENVEHGKTGYLVLSDIIDFTCINRETINYMYKVKDIKSEDCRDNVKRFFDRKYIFDKTLKFFKSLRDSQDNSELVTIETNLRLGILAKKILTNLYHNILYKDDLFHYFWEPYLILRVDYRIAKRVEKFIQNSGYSTKRYSYPSGNGKHIEHPDGIVLKKFGYFVELFHLNSKYSLLSPYGNEALEIRERVIHTLYNQHHKLGNNESDEIIALGKSREEYNKKWGYE